MTNLIYKTPKINKFFSKRLSGHLWVKIQINCNDIYGRNLNFCCANYMRNCELIVTSSTCFLLILSKISIYKYLNKHFPFLHSFIFFL